MEYLCKAAIYMRLSREDRDKINESSSISSQRHLLQQCAAKLHIPVCAEYIDDGESGTKWERTGLQEMLSAIEERTINTVLVKDLSRLSRDYIRTGELLEKWFPQHRVRFISVDDGIDTAAPSAVTEYSAIRAVMDDWYARDISKKVRAALYSRQKAGFCTSASIPYGYRKSNGKIEIEPEQAEIIRRIFKACIEGACCITIAEKLNALNIPSPQNAITGWSNASIRYILKNPAYTGRLHQHVTRKISYKSNMKAKLQESEHIIIRIPPLITDAEFEQAQHILQIHSHKRDIRHWLSGKAECGVCGSIMTILSEKSNKRMICSGRRRKNGCCNPSQNLEMLLTQISDAVSSAGLSSDEDSLRRMIRRICITKEQATVFLSCRKPRSAHDTISDNPFV